MGDFISTVFPINPFGVAGVNEKFIGKRLCDGRIGVVKFSLSNDSLDSVNEVICYHLGQLFGIDVAEASLEYFNGRQCVISCYPDNSVFEYNIINSLN